MGTPVLEPRRSARLAGGARAREIEDEVEKTTVDNRTRSKRPGRDGDIKDDDRPKSKIAKQTASAKKTDSDIAPSGQPNDVSDSSSGGDGPHEQQTFWLFKSEPETRMTKGVDVRFSIDDLAACSEPEPWTGVRNYLARNNMREMKKNDLAFFYHSNTKIPAIVGICRVAEEATVDETAFEAADPYFDPKSDRADPRWFCVKVVFESKFGRPIALAELQKEAAKKDSLLSKMQVATMRRSASVSRVSRAEWEWIISQMG